MKIESLVSAVRDKKNVNLDIGGDKKVAAEEYRYDNYSELQLHQHIFYEIVYVASGNGLHILNSVTSTVSRGYVFLLREGDVHSFYPNDIKNSGDLKVINCMFRRELLGLMQTDDKEALQVLNVLSPAKTPELNEILQLHPPKGSMLNQLESIMNQLLIEHSMAFAASEFYMMTLVYQVLACIYRIYHYSQAENSSFDIINHDTAYAAIAYMREKYSEKLSLDQIAKHCMLSKNRLAAIFKNVTGSTIFNYLEGVRIEKACELLGATDEKVGVVAKAVGYSDPSYFVKVFKQHTRQTPQAYRERVR